MENAANETISLATLLGTAGISAVVVGIFGLITLLLNRHWAKKDETSTEEEQ